jgi:hypothetical protein
MPVLMLYMIKLSCSLALIWSFYRWFLRNLTFYDLNRWYLLGYSLLSFLIPLIDIGPMLERNAASDPLVIQFIPSIGQYTPAIATGPSQGSPGWSAWNVLLGAMLLGAFLLFVRMTMRWLSLRRLRSVAVLIGDVAGRAGGSLAASGSGIRIYQVDEAIIPFSFGRSIYINGDLHTEKEWEEIILHEYVHIRQRHTIDIVLAEWLCILNWYNPFVWLIRHSIRQNLEFIADRKVLEKGCDKKGYQYHLLKVVGEPHYRLANNFNFSSLKKRIVMMNKLRTARLHLVKFLFILPLLAVLLVAFRDKYTGIWRRSSGPVYVNAAGIVLDLAGKTPLEGVTVHERATGLETKTDANGFYRLRIPVTHDSVRVHLDYIKDGYEQDFRERFVPSLKETIGIIDIGTLKSKTAAFHSVFMVAPYLHRLPAEPSYADALAALKETMQMNDDAQRFFDMRKAHPEVALFYTTEDKLKQLVIHTDGMVERYGYPGGPGVEEMEKKYGQLPQWSKPGGNTAGSGYLAHWASISLQAEKDFHTTNPMARAIIFPGDSRVIAVDASGKARFYDMDNDDPNERGAFEKEYGRLPDCVPAGFHYPQMPRIDPRKDTLRQPLKDTVPEVTVRGMPRDTLHRASKDTLQDKHEIPGDGDHHDVLRFSSSSQQPPLLFVVDGIEKTHAEIGKLNPGEISYIQVLKDSAAVRMYGPKGQNGVVLIHLKTTMPPKP